MRKFSFLAALFLTLVAPAPSAKAETRASMDEAKAMAVAAAKLLEDRGIDASKPIFMDPQGSFRNRDLYVAVYDRNGVCLANGASAAIVGKNMIDFKDIDGKPTGRETIGVTAPTWIEYKWPNPTTKLVEEKTTYVIPVGNLLVMVGAYKSR